MPWTREGRALPGAVRAAGRIGIRVALAVVMTLLVVGCQALSPMIPSPPGTATSSAGGAAVECVGLEYSPEEADATAEDLAAVRQVVLARLQEVGLAFASVTVEPVDRLTVVVPRFVEEDRLRRLILARGRLDLVPLPRALEPPADGTALYERHPELRPLITSGSIDRRSLEARAAEDRQGWVVAYSLLEPGRSTFLDWARENAGTYFSVVLDGVVLATPVARSEMSGDVELSGEFDRDEAMDLVNVLRHGVLPVGMQETAFGLTRCPA